MPKHNRIHIWRALIKNLKAIDFLFFVFCFLKSTPLQAQVCDWVFFDTSALVQEARHPDLWQPSPFVPQEMISQKHGKLIPMQVGGFTHAGIYRIHNTYPPRLLKTYQTLDARFEDLRTEMRLLKGNLLGAEVGAAQIYSVGFAKITDSGSRFFIEMEEVFPNQAPHFMKTDALLVDPAIAQKVVFMAIDMLNASIYPSDPDFAFSVDQARWMDTDQWFRVPEQNFYFVIPSMVHRWPETAQKVFKEAIRKNSHSIHNPKVRADALEWADAPK
jgi:hypothetical protein